MKKNTILILIGLTTTSLTLISCNSTKKLERTTKAQEITVPFSENKYKTDKDFLRAKQMGKSPDLATAKKIALQNAKAELAGNINALIKRVTDQYTNQRTVENKQSFENKFEELSREVVEQSLSNVSIKDEKIFKEKDNTYSHWVVIEISKESLIEKLNNKISKNEKLKLDYDKKKFEDTFNSEIEKLSKEL